MRKHFLCWFLMVVLVTMCWSVVAGQPSSFLVDGKLRAYVERFNALDSEYAVNSVPNSKALGWMAANIPLFECPDTTLEKIYYYRWWTFRKHLKQTPDGYVLTEFITPMKHGGLYNTISSALGHHVYEGRWLRDTQIINQYIRFWLYADKATPKPHLHNFSSWLQNAVYHHFLVTHDSSFIIRNFDELVADYKLWEIEKQLPDGKFWQYDVRDAMEESISGGRKEKNVRPTINSYMYGNAVALANMADITGNAAAKKLFNEKAAILRSVVQDYLWNDTSTFFEVRKESGAFAQAREALGYIPWYFNLPYDKTKYAAQWNQLTDTAGFCAPWGITTAERRHPGFRTHGSGHGCEWDGALWPFATTQTLKGLANLLNNYNNKGAMNRKVFYDELLKYAASHTKNGQPYIGEYQDEKTGYWLKGDNPRSSYYNHSGFADLVINDLIGLRPQPGNTLVLQPLLPNGTWDWFCLENVPYHGKLLSVYWDKKGNKYGRGKGLRVYADGKLLYKSKQLQAARIAIN